MGSGASITLNILVPGMSVVEVGQPAVEAEELHANPLS